MNSLALEFGIDSGLQGCGPESNPFPIDFELDDAHPNNVNHTEWERGRIIGLNIKTLRMGSTSKA